MSRKRRNNTRAATREVNERILGSQLGNMNMPETLHAMRINQYVKLIEQLAVSRFKWKNLPPYIDERYLELTLFENGLALFFPDKNLHRFMVTSGNIGGVNNYDNPTEFTPVATGYSYRTLTGRECVPIWDNQLRCTMRDVCWNYATRLANCDRALDVNLDNLSIPLIIVTGEQGRLTANNLMRAREDGQPYVYMNDATDINGMFNTFPNSTPFLADKLLNAKQQVWNELINFLGIDNSSTEKKERLLEDEIQSSNSRTNVYRLTYLKARQQACDAINRLYRFDYPIGVEWNDLTTGGLLDAKGATSKDFIAVSETSAQGVQQPGMGGELS